MKVRDELKGLTKIQLNREKDHVKWRLRMASNCMYNTEKYVLKMAQADAEYREGIKFRRSEALDDYIAGNIDERTYKRRVTECDHARPPRADYRRRFEELDAFIEEQNQILKEINFMLTRKEFDRTKKVSKYNQDRSGQGFKIGNPYGGRKNPNWEDLWAKKGEVRNPWGRKGKPKEVKEAEEKARIEQEKEGEYWKR